MKLATAVKIARPIKVVQNSASKNSHQWGQIRDAVSNKVLHTGQLAYIKAVAKRRYNFQVTLA